MLSTEAIKSPLTGIGRYVYELAQRLQKDSLDVKFFRAGRVLNDFDPPSPNEAPLGPSAWKRRLSSISVLSELYRYANSFVQRRKLKGYEDHLFHGPNYYLPSFGGRSLATIHDLSIFLYPDTHPPERVRHMQVEINKTLKQASALITDTEFTRQEVVNYFNCPIDRVFAVPLAAGAEFYPRDQVALEPDLRGLGLQYKGYSLYVGTIEPRKNLLTLLNAYDKLPCALKKRYPLVLAGYQGWESADIHKRIRQAEQQGWVRYLGYVSHTLLPNLIAGSSLFVYPSLYEGFGLPVLEAMASGVPVVCSNASTLPEVAGNAAKYHAPLDIDGLALAIEEGLEDELWRQGAVTAGLARAAAFSWDRCAAETIAVYQKVMAL